MSVNIPDLPGLDKNNLYRQDAFTDLKVGTLQRLVPIKTDGSDDTSRTTRFVASTSIMTPQGMLPVQADIEAKDLAEAVEKFPQAIKDGVQQMIKEAQEYEREARSGIVIPRGGAGGMGNAGGKPGGGLVL